MRALRDFDQLERLAPPKAFRHPRALLIEIAIRYALMDPTTREIRRSMAMIREHLPDLDRVPERLPVLSPSLLGGFRRIVLMPPEYRDPFGPLPRLRVDPHSSLTSIFGRCSAAEAWRSMFYWHSWEARRSRELVRWCFAGHPEEQVLIDTAGWLRWYLVHFAARAGEILVRAEEHVLSAFLASCRPKDINSLPGLQRAFARSPRWRRSRVLADWIVEEADERMLHRLTSGGSATALAGGVRSVGVHVLGWPWVKRLIDSWRRILDDVDRRSTDAPQARDMLAEVAAALVYQGKGRTPQERRGGREGARRHRLDQIRRTKAVRRLIRRIEKERLGVNPRWLPKPEVVNRVLRNYKISSRLEPAMREQVIVHVRELLKQDEG